MQKILLNTHIFMHSKVQKYSVLRGKKTKHLKKITKYIM